MAERRMFAKTIIDSDAFLDMPLSAQSLYFHLSMRADDDGFINNPKKIQRMIGASDDDLRLLNLKKFIIGFDSGIIVIKHWKIHNYIQSDRYKPTIYTEEKAMLSQKKSKAYTLETECIHDVYIEDTQVRLGKDRLGKDRLGKTRECIDPGENVEETNEPLQDCYNVTPANAERESINYQQIADLYNDTCVSLPRVTSLSEARRKAIRARLKTYSLDDLKRVFEKAEASNFLKGANARNWNANFDWLLKDSNIAKVLDGNYDNVRAPAAGAQAAGNRIARQLDESYNMIAEWAESEG